MRWAIAVGLLAVLGLFGLAGTLRLEERDEFCASCHTQPEVEYVARRNAERPLDLASQHAHEDVPCVLCHSGPGIVGRLTTLPQAAWNAGRFALRLHASPARLRHPIADATCVQCHAEAVEDRGFQNHFHSYLLTERTNVGCASCHTAHTLEATDEFFLHRQTVEAGCNQCHRELERGPSDLQLRRLSAPLP